ncbi:hypothetical protein BKA80DRAFT_44879 [Phyllosticta citrichinensis]
MKDSAVKTSWTDEQFHMFHSRCLVSDAQFYLAVSCRNFLVPATLHASMFENGHTMKSRQRLPRIHIISAIAAR